MPVECGLHIVQQRYRNLFIKRATKKFHEGIPFGKVGRIGEISWSAQNWITAISPLLLWLAPSHQVHVKGIECIIMIHNQPSNREAEGPEKAIILSWMEFVPNRGIWNIFSLFVSGWLWMWVRSRRAGVPWIADVRHISAWVPIHYAIRRHNTPNSSARRRRGGGKATFVSRWLSNIYLNHHYIITTPSVRYLLVGRGRGKEGEIAKAE